MGWRVGDEVQAQKAAGDTYLANDRFSIVGIANHPDHTSISIPEPLYLIATRDDFDMAALDDCFMKAEIVVDKPAGVDRFDAKYESTVDAVSARLDALSGKRTSIRDVEIQGKIQSQLDDAQTQLDEAMEKLQKARVDLDEGWSTLGEGETQIAEKETELSDARAQLAKSWDQLQDAAKQLEEGRRKLDDAESKLAAGRSALSKGRKQLDEGRKELIRTWDQLEEAKAQVRSTIRSKLGSAGKHVKWASRRKADIDDPDQKATDFWLTSSLKFDLNASLKQNVKKLIYSGEIPDEALIALYEHLTGGDQ